MCPSRNMTAILFSKLLLIFVAWIVLYCSWISGIAYVNNKHCGHMNIFMRKCLLTKQSSLSFLVPTFYIAYLHSEDKAMHYVYNHFDIVERNESMLNVAIVFMFLFSIVHIQLCARMTVSFQIKMMRLFDNGFFRLIMVYSVFICIWPFYFSLLLVLAITVICLAFFGK